MIACVTDPVCGMTFPPEMAAAQLVLKDRTYYFCAEACRSRFVAEPEQYDVHSRRGSLGPKFGTLGRQVETRPATPVETGAHSTRCPLCGGETGIQRAVDDEFGTVSLDELQTLVRNEWRRRLGRDSYARDHSEVVIRALLVYALAPESAVREVVVRKLVWWELEALGAWGLDRAAVVNEFRSLTGAIRDTLCAVGIEAGLAAEYSSAAERELRDVLDWPDWPEPEPTAGATRE